MIKFHQILQKVKGANKKTKKNSEVEPKFNCFFCQSRNHPFISYPFLDSEVTKEKGESRGTTDYSVDDDVDDLIKDSDEEDYKHDYRAQASKEIVSSFR